MRRALAPLVALLLVLFPAARAQLELHFIDVGQGDAVLIRTPNGQAVLYDGGESAAPVLRYLDAVGVRSLDLVVASHAHADHAGGLVEVVAGYRPGYYMDNGVPHTTATYDRLLRAVEEAGSLYLAPTARTLSLGGVTLQVLPPPGRPGFGQNDNSVGLLVTYGTFRAALAGDAEAREFGWWAENHPELLVDVDVYKASHHGSENGDTPLSMDRFRPEVVVIGVGAGNRYGHPSARALRLYAAVEAEVFRTDLHGHVVVRVAEDGSYEVAPARDAPPAAVTPDAAPAPSPDVAAGSGAVRIRCVLYDPDGRDDGRELVTLVAARDVDVSGWTLVDAADHRFPLPSRMLTAGETLDVPNPGRPAWNNGGDTATLHDAAGSRVDAFTYPGGGSRACR